MNFEETKELGAWCAGAFPQQKWAENTPAVWAELLEPYSAADAKAAAKTLVQRQPFIALSDMITEIKAIRRKRFNGVSPEILGAGADADDIAGFLEAVKSDVKAIGDGVPVDEIEAGSHRPVDALIAGLANRRAIEGTVS